MRVRTQLHDINELWIWFIEFYTAPFFEQVTRRSGVICTLTEFQIYKITDYLFFN